MLVAVLLSLIVGSVDSQTAAVLVGRRTSVSQAEAEAISQAVSAHLVAAKVPLTLDADAARASLNKLGLKDASACTGRKACLTELGRQLSVAWVVALSLSQVGNDRALALELVRVADGVAVEKDALILAPGAKVSSEQVAGFASRALQHLTPPREDRPVVEVPAPPKALTPKEPPPATPIVSAPVLPAQRSHVASFVLGGAGVVALGVATGLLVSGLNTRAEAYRTSELDGALRSPYPASEVQRRASAGGVQLGVAGALAAAGLGLGTAAVITW